MSYLLIERSRALELLDQAMQTCRSIDSKYVELFDVLLEIETTLAYREVDIPSLHIYCVDMLQLTRQVANDFVCVVKKAIEVPALAEAIRSKKVSVSKARKLCPVIDQSNYADWIALGANCSCRVVEKAVAMAKPREAIGESLKYVSGDVLELKVAVSEEWSELLKRTKDLLSQKHRRNVSTEEALPLLMADFCKKSDPIRKAERALSSADASRTKPKSEQKSPEKLSRDNFRERRRPMAIEHAVNFRDQGGCVFVYSDGRRCNSKRWLHKHHIKHFAAGGEHHPENLETLCWAHHQIRHVREG